MTLMTAFYYAGSHSNESLRLKNSHVTVIRSTCDTCDCPVVTYKKCLYTVVDAGIFHV